jgi:lambda family phage portal protein
MMQGNWIDRAVGYLSPQRALRRVRARMAVDLLERTAAYDAASTGRRTQGWRRSSSDANAALGPSLGKLRDAARDLVRNNAYAESALNTIVDHTVGWGIEARALPANERVMERWGAWADTTACDADGRHNFAGLQKLVMRAAAGDGEVIVRRRSRRLEDKLPIPLQLQVLEADFIDTSKDGIYGGNRVIQGVEVDAIGRRVAYWLHKSHPGSSTLSSGITFGGSQRVPASEILHVFKVSRPGQMRAPSWFSAVLLRFKDFDDYVDAQLVKQKVAACLAVITSDVDGTGAPLGSTDTADPTVDTLSPGGILNVAAGRKVDVVQPPSVGEYKDFCSITLHEIATGLGVTYEDLTGNYENLPFSAARMSRLRHWARVDDWRWRLLIPQFCDPVWGWAMEALELLGGLAERPAAHWTAPPPPMIEPDKEGTAYQRLIRTGLMTPSEAIRERGYDPDELLAEYAADLQKLDALGITLDCDARKMTAFGQTQTDANGAKTEDAR